MAKRSRAISLSLDWDNIVKDDDAQQKSQTYRVAGAIVYERPNIEFCTGSSYCGKWNTLGMAVYGNYTFPYGCEYEGGMEDGMFHGKGALLYPMGQKLEGIWQRGNLISYKFSNIDGLEYDDPWTYCQMPDRRFTVSMREGLQAAGREFLTNQQPTRKIIEGCYDTGDGFFNPKSKIITPARDPADYMNFDERDDDNEVERPDIENDFWLDSIVIVTPEREDWIKKNCRKAWDESSGYRPDFYEDWITGRKEELDKLDEKYTKKMQKQSEASFINGHDYSFSASSDQPELSDTNTFEYAGTGRKLGYSKSDLLQNVGNVKR